jgi:hypothetical protein
MPRPGAIILRPGTVARRTGIVLLPARGGRRAGARFTPARVPSRRFGIALLVLVAGRAAGRTGARLAGTAGRFGGGLLFLCSVAQAAVEMISRTRVEIQLTNVCLRRWLKYIASSLSCERHNRAGIGVASGPLLLP